MTEPLGSIPDPKYAGSYANKEIVNSLRRVRVATLGDISDASWRVLARDFATKIGAREYIGDSVVNYHLRHRSTMRKFNRREAAAALFFIFSKNYLKASKSFREICHSVGANRVKAGKYLTHFILDDSMTVRPKHPEDYVKAYGARLNLSGNVVARGAEIAELYQDKSITSITPRTLAAGALYLASRENGHPYTQKEIAQTLGLAEYTVREVSVRMKKTLGGLVESPR